MKDDAPKFLPPLRWGAGLVRGRFELHWGGNHYVVDSFYLDFDERIRLYQNGHHVDSARRKARFTIGPSAQIEAAVSKLGMKYVRFRDTHTGQTRPLAPMPGTGEGWRARIGQRHPAASRLVGALATAVLIAVLLLELPQLINLAGMLAPHVGLPGFEIPMIALNAWQNLLVIVIGGAAALERGLSMKYHPLLDD